MDPLDCRPRLITEMHRRFCRDENACEDAVDEAISRLLKIELKTENIFPLLYQISKNILFDRKKRRGVARRRIKILRHSLEGPPTPLESAVWTELESCLKLELLSFKDRERLAFELFCFDELSHKEIATKIGVSGTAAKTLICRMRRVLRGRLERFSA